LLFIYLYKLLGHCLNYNSAEVISIIACFILSTVFAHFYTLHEVETEVEDESEVESEVETEAEVEVEDEIAIEFYEIRKNDIEYV